MVIDTYGREITAKQTEVVARASGWNVGISEITANENIRVSISRTSYERLIGVTCTLSIDSPDNSWTSERIVDIGGLDRAPIIEFNNPGVFDDDDEIRAEFRCASPYDIDDNPDDDTAKAFYKSADSTIIESSQVAFSVLTIIVVLSVAYLAGILTTNKPRGVKPKKVVEDVLTTESDDEEEEIIPPQNDEIDDFSLELEQESSANDVIEIIEDEDETDPVEVEDHSASGRLASLRDEILTDDKPVDSRPISDRMADFFKD